MAGPWEKYQSQGKSGPWSKYSAADEQPEDKSQSGMILPFSRDAEGNLGFDSDAGILGSLKRTFTLPGEVMKGEVDPLSQEGIGRALEFATTVSPMNPAVRSGDRAVPGVLKNMRKNVKAPSSEALYSAADDAFNSMRESGVAYSTDAVRDFALKTKTGLDADGFIAKVSPKTQSVLDELANPPEGAVADIKGMHAARKAFGRIARNFNEPEEQAAATRVIRGLDEFIGTDNPAAVVAGTASDASQALKAGNANYAAASRSDLLTGIERGADLRASAANSGANTGNAIRGRVASALLKPKEIAGYSPEEVKALETIVTGTPVQNATRYVGNLLGGGGGLGQMLTTAVGAGAGGAAGGAGGAVLGAAVPLAVGASSKAVSNALTRKALNAADDLVRTRSPLYEQLLRDAPMEAIPAGKKAALIRALLLQQQQAEQQ